MHNTLLWATLSRQPREVKGTVSSPLGLTISITTLKIKYFQWYLKFHISLSNITVLHLKNKYTLDLLRVNLKVNTGKRTYKTRPGLSCSLGAGCYPWSKKEVGFLTDSGHFFPQKYKTIPLVIKLENSEEWKCYHLFVAKMLCERRSNPG